MNQNRPVTFPALVLLSMLIFSTCKDDKCIKSPNVSHVEVTVKIERLDKKLHKIRTKNELELILKQNPVFTSEFLQLSQYPNAEILIDRYFQLMNSGGIDSLFIEVEKTFGDLEEIQLQFEDAFRHLKFYFPDLKIPKIQTAVTGISHDLYVSDSLILIGLDYYLGIDGKYLPQNIPMYILKRYQKDYLVPQIMLLYSAYYNTTNFADKTALADMIYYGKAFYLTKNLMPCTPDSLLTGYTAFETEDIVEHEDIIWAGLLENEMLFETNNFLKSKILGERPTTIEIGEKCPGRIGRWVGWRIIQKYAREHPELSVPDIMNIDDAQRIFSESKYKPINY